MTKAITAAVALVVAYMVSNLWYAWMLVVFNWQATWPGRHHYMGSCNCNDIHLDGLESEVNQRGGLARHQSRQGGRQ